MSPQNYLPHLTLPRVFVLTVVLWCVNAYTDNVKENVAEKVRATEESYCKAALSGKSKPLSKPEITDLVAGYSQLYKGVPIAHQPNSQVMIAYFARHEGKIENWLPLFDGVHFRNDGMVAAALVHLVLSSEFANYLQKHPSKEIKTAFDSLLESAVESDDAAFGEIYRAYSIHKLTQEQSAIAEAAINARGMPMPGNEEGDRVLAAMPLLDPRNDINAYCKQLTASHNSSVEAVQDAESDEGSGNPPNGPATREQHTRGR